MNVLLSNMKTTLICLTVFVGIPYLWWYLKSSKKESFFQWIGFKCPIFSNNWKRILLFLFAYYFFTIFDLSKIVEPSDLASMGILSLASKEYLPSSIPITPDWSITDVLNDISLFVVNFFGYTLTIEVFYRGFLCKRLISHIGTNGGIIMQGIIFGLLQTVLFAVISPYGVQVDQLFNYFLLLFLPHVTLGAALAYLNEKIFSGSILPSVMLRGFLSVLTTTRAVLRI